MSATDPLDPEKWVDEHGDSLYRYAVSRVRDRTVAEDLVQETFFSALKARDRFKDTGSERAWLMGILKHKVVDHFRAAAKEAPLPEFEGEELTNSRYMEFFGVPKDKPEPWRFNPRKAFEQKEFWGVFTNCLARLNAQMNAAFTLKEIEGYSTEAICKELDVKPNHLWVILHRARAQLKTCLETNWIKKTGAPS